MSRGSTHILAASSGVDPREEPPRIDLAFLEHPADVHVLAAGVATADRAFRSKALASRTVRRVMPPSGIDLEDETRAREYVLQNIMCLTMILAHVQWVALWTSDCG